MLKKYGFIMLLLLGLCGVRSALASCAFTTPTGTYIDQTMASSPVTAVTLTSTNLQQLFQSSVLVGGPVISTCNGYRMLMCKCCTEQQVIPVGI